MGKNISSSETTVEVNYVNMISGDIEPHGVFDYVIMLIISLPNQIRHDYLII